MRQLTDQECAVFDAVIDQFKKSGTIDGLFIYDLVVGQQYLRENNTSIINGISPIDQYNILLKLAKDGILRVNLMTVNEDKNGKRKIGWVLNTDWAPKYVQGDMSIEECYKKYETRIFILLFDEEINRINTMCRPAYQAHLIFDNDNYSLFHIHIDGDSDYYFRQLREDGYPFKIFSYAIERYKKNGEASIKRKDLIDCGIMRVDQPYVSNLFKDQPVFREALPPFVSIYTKGLKVKDLEVTITENERRLIQKHSIKRV